MLFVTLKTRGHVMFVFLQCPSCVRRCVRRVSVVCLSCVRRLSTACAFLPNSVARRHPHELLQSGKRARLLQLPAELTNLLRGVGFRRALA